MNNQWWNKVPLAITICDREGTIIYMNESSAQMFAKNGGYDLIGSNLLDCHPGPAREKLENLLSNGLSNCYTTEKNGLHKLVYQVPWQTDDGTFAGLAEFGMPVPDEIPHFIRK